MKKSTASLITSSSSSVLATVLLLLCYTSLSLARPSRLSYLYQDSDSSQSEEVYQDRLLFPDEIPREIPTYKQYKVKSISNLNYPQNAYYTRNSLGGFTQSDPISDILSGEETELENEFPEFDFRLGGAKRTSYSSTHHFEPCGHSRGDEKSRFSSSSTSKFIPCGSKPQGTKG